MVEYREAIGLFGSNRCRLARLRTDLLDRVAQLAAEDELARPSSPRVQPLVEGELAVLVEPDQLEFAQLLDEAAEQGPVEELRRGRRVEQRSGAARSRWHRLSSSPRAERAGAVLHQHRDRDVVALERLLQRVRRSRAGGTPRRSGRRCRRRMPPSSSSTRSSRPSRDEHLDGALRCARRTAPRSTAGTARPAGTGRRLRPRRSTPAAAHAPVVLEAAARSTPRPRTGAARCCGSS